MQNTGETCWPDQVKVLVGCSRHPGHHLVNHEGFHLLELVEGTMGTTLQKAREVEDNGGEIGYQCGEFALGLVSRIERQKQPLQRFFSESVYIHGGGIYATLLKNATEWENSRILVGSVGKLVLSWIAAGV